MKHKRKGFTIVELLIVIVVIGILAAISIVAYNNVQRNANNAMTIDATAKYIKAYSLYAIDKGAHPTASGCLGDGYPGNRCLSQNNTSACFGLGSGSATTTTLNSELAPYMGGKVPSPSMQLAPCGGTNYVGSYAWYNAGNGKVTIVSILRGDVSCPALSPNVESYTTSFEGGATRCSYYLGIPRT